MEDQLGYSRRFVADLQKLQKFLLSVTAKDVSVLLTFRRLKRKVEQTTGSESEAGKICLDNINIPGCGDFRVMISVIDLDPKPVHRIPTWIGRRQDWYKSYLKN